MFDLFIGKVLGIIEVCLVGTISPVALFGWSEDLCLQ